MLSREVQHTENKLKSHRRHSMPTPSLHAHVCWHAHSHIHVHTQNKVKVKQEHQQTLQEGEEPTLDRASTTSKPLGTETNTAMEQQDLAWQGWCMTRTIAEMPGNRQWGKLGSQATGTEGSPLYQSSPLRPPCKSEPSTVYFSRTFYPPLV